MTASPAKGAGKAAPVRRAASAAGPRGASRATAPAPRRAGPVPPRPPVDTRPKPKRLRPNRTHRKAALAELPAEQQPVAEQVLKGGIPAVRAAVAKQNEQARAEGKPEVKADQLVDLAETLLPRLRAAEWLDRAEAAMADLEELDLRDLRSVIVAAEGAARDDESRALATSLREGLARRVDQEQSAWLREIASTLGEGRVVRALRLSSRPPKAGEPLPADLAGRLIEATNAALAADTVSDRWATVLDALSFSPVHLRVEPVSIPAEPDETLLTAVRAAAARVPQIAARFGIDPATTPPPRRGGAPGGRRRPRGGRPAGSGQDRPAGEAKAAPAADAPIPPPPPREEPEAAPVADAPAPARAGRSRSLSRPPSAEPSRRSRPGPEPADEPAPPPVPEPGTPEAEPSPAADPEPDPEPEPETS